MLELKELTDKLDYLEKTRESDDWKRALADCWLQYRNAAYEDRASEDYWLGVLHMCTAAYYHVEGRLTQAIDEFRASERIFKEKGHRYGHGMALMGLGQVYQAMRKREQAIRTYEQSRRIFQALHEEAGQEAKTLKPSRYQALSTRLQSMIEALKQPQEVHLIPIIEEIGAGVPLYMPSEGGEYPTGEIVIDGDKYQLLTLGEREPIICFVFSPSAKYFIMAVRGNSMVEAGIDSGDLLLVRQQDATPEQGAIAVIQEESSGTMIKRFYHSGKRIFLESANPSYPSRVYDKDSSRLRMLGVVVAILQSADQP